MKLKFHARFCSGGGAGDCLADHVKPQLHSRGQDLIDLYAEVGYECLIIWEDELDSAIEKIAAFINLSEWQLCLPL